MTVIADKPGNGLLLPGVEPSARRPSPPLGPQGLRAALLALGNPGVNGRTADAENPGHLGLGTACLQRGHRLEAEGLLRLRRQRAEIRGANPV